MLNNDDFNLEEYINETAYSQQFLDIDSEFSEGSLKITDKLARQCKIAVENRIENTKGDTKERLDRINKGFELYYSNNNQASSLNSLQNIFVPEIYNAVQDMLDSLYLMFSELTDNLSVKKEGADIEEFLIRKIELTEKDDTVVRNILRKFLQLLVGKQNFSEEDNYFFKKSDVIKSFLKNKIDKSKYKQNLLLFLWYGIIGGMFVLKDNWGLTGKYKLVYSDKKVKKEVDQEDIYRFMPIDPRRLIFPKSGMEWVIEKIDTTYQKLLSSVLDINGKPKKNAPYDLERVKELGKKLKEQGFSGAKEKPKTSEVTNTESSDHNDEDTNLFDIDGNITIYESHLIPLELDNGIYQAMITQVNLVPNSDEVNLFAIGCKKTPYIIENPYTYTNLILKDGDISGSGLPEILEPLQILINEFINNGVDNINMGLWGIMLTDKDKIVDPSVLKNLTPKQIIDTKNLRGAPLENVVKWLRPNLETIPYMQNMYDLFTNMLQRTSRTGPSGEKISPNPSATEFESIAKEQQKSINKVGLRLNDMLCEMIERMYVYNILNYKDNLTVNAQSFKIIDKNKLPSEETPLIGDLNTNDYKIIEKTLELTPEDLFVEGIEFKLDCADIFNNFQ
jgi:hypothetical protein